MVETATRVLVIAGVRQLARRRLESLQVKTKELVLLQVGHFVGMHAEAVVGPLAIGLALRGLIDEGVEVHLVRVVRVLAGLRVPAGTCSSQRQSICVG